MNMLSPQLNDEPANVKKAVYVYRNANECSRLLSIIHQILKWYRQKSYFSELTIRRRSRNCQWISDASERLIQWPDAVPIYMADMAQLSANCLFRPGLRPASLFQYGTQALETKSSERAFSAASPAAWNRLVSYTT